MIVVKVGGSLFDWPELGARLRAFLASLDAPDVLLVPGGGATADAIRVFDRTHHLGEAASHWLALDALSVNALFLQHLLPEARLVTEVARPGLAILDPAPFFHADDRRPDHLPHSWQVTGDSLAARAAVIFRARALILLKSVAWAGADWRAAHRAGVVDGYFAEALAHASTEMSVRVVNLRGYSEPAG
jgi:aspartokinase-like uncharacterized kinase